MEKCARARPFSTFLFSIAAILLALALDSAALAQTDSGNPFYPGTPQHDAYERPDYVGNKKGEVPVTNAKRLLKNVKCVRKEDWAHWLWWLHGIQDDIRAYKQYQKEYAQEANSLTLQAEKNLQQANSAKEEFPDLYTKLAEEKLKEAQRKRDSEKLWKDEAAELQGLLDALRKIPTCPEEKATQTAPTQPGQAAAPAKPATPPPFHSPFNGDKDSTGEEAKDFGKLLDLYGAVKDAASALESAVKCGSADDVKKAHSEYIKGWSSVATNGLSQAELESNPLYKKEKEKALDALSKADKKSHAVGECPPKTQTGTGSSSPKSTGGGGKGKPKKRRHGKRAITEDNPAYMENYQPPANSHVSAPRSHSDSDEGEAPPPQDDSGQQRRTPDLPQPPNSNPY
jgi:hypothetical protein